MQMTAQDAVRIVKGNIRGDELETFKEETTIARRGGWYGFRCKLWQPKYVTDSSLLWVVNVSLCSMAHLSLLH